MQPVSVVSLPLDQLGELIGPERSERFLSAAASAREMLAGRTIWNINATAQGGGVAEMLQTILSGALGLQLDTRWLVLDGEAEFFAITKRLHNMLHGDPGDGGQLGAAQREQYEAVLATNTATAVELIKPGDIVLLHDPQTAGMIKPLRDLGAHVIWRSHIGKDETNELAHQAWDFLRPYVEQAEAIVVSRPTYAPPFADPDMVFVVPPSIDPFAVKNIWMDPQTVIDVLVLAGVTTGAATSTPINFPRRDGGIGTLRTHDDLMVTGGPLPEGTPYVLQVSRWDRLKDMAGVMTAFVDHVTGHEDVHLLLVGPATAGVTDDPEGAEVLAECLAAWRALPPETQQRVHLVCVPMDDIDENAYIINALQRAATVVVQKSLVEGFGLTVTEAMWKGRPVLASDVGGIADQIEDGVSGLLLADPTDLATCGELLARVLSDSELAERLGAAGHERVLERFLGDRHLLQYGELFAKLLGAPPLQGDPVNEPR
ncbi:MAG TPA: glycosyltransferase [Marmoricola sp.]|nr:glycosyltransferase [Marmoricola sp.]